MNKPNKRIRDRLNGLKKSISDKINSKSSSNETVSQKSAEAATTKKRKGPVPLPHHTVVDNYRVEKILGSGGFSVVYLASDLKQQTPVVLKEYIPVTIARRKKDLTVIPLDKKQSDRFVHGRKLFFQEAGTLSKLKHPNIVNVINFFRENGTVYMVMEYEEGHNLHAYIKKTKGNVSEKFLMAVFVPLLRGLNLIHDNGLLHLDIKPSNIHLRPGGNPLLLDFGAVHEMLQVRQLQPNQVITPGFSPVEQLSIDGYVGPWTDIYAIGATMRACMDGKAPPISTLRRENDTLPSAIKQYKGKYSKTLLEVVDWAMEVDPLLRAQDANQLLTALKNTSNS